VVGGDGEGGCGEAHGVGGVQCILFWQRGGRDGDHASGVGADAVVDALDEEGVHRHYGSPASISSVYDMNRDGLVDGADEWVVAASHSGARRCCWLECRACFRCRQRTGRRGD